MAFLEQVKKDFFGEAKNLDAGSLTPEQLKAIKDGHADLLAYQEKERASKPKPKAGDNGGMGPAVAVAVDPATGIKGFGKNSKPTSRENFHPALLAHIEAIEAKTREYGINPKEVFGMENLGQHAEVSAMNDLLGKLQEAGHEVDSATLDRLLLGIIRKDQSAFPRCPNCQSILQIFAAYTDFGNDFEKSL